MNTTVKPIYWVKYISSDHSLTQIDTADLSTSGQVVLNVLMLLAAFIYTGIWFRSSVLFERSFTITDTFEIW